MSRSRWSLVLIATAPLALAGPAESRALSPYRAPVGPTPTVPPTVIGSIAAGKRVTGLSGGWAGTGTIRYRFQWYRCNAAGSQCRAIYGATAPTYALVARDVGRTVGLTVTATDSTGLARANTSLVGPVAPRRPLLESTVQPVIDGPPVEGKTAHVSTGTWSPAPTTVSYTWERCAANARVCGAIPGATGNAYTLAAADVGHALVVLVQATFGTTSQTTLSTATPAVVDSTVAGPARVVPPGIMGTAAQGRQLVAATGIWKGVGPIGFGFRWYRCDATGSHCASIHGATGATYELAAQDVGQTVGLTVRATDSTGAMAAYTSLVGPVSAANAALSATAQPTITGTAKTGRTLTVSNGAWTVTPTAFAYSWLRCNRNGRLCAAIPAAAAATYKVTAADAGHALVAVVRASWAGGAQSSLSTSTVPGA